MADIGGVLSDGGCGWGGSGWALRVPGALHRTDVWLGCPESLLAGGALRGPGFGARIRRIAASRMGGAAFVRQRQEARRTTDPAWKRLRASKPDDPYHRSVR